MVCGKRVLFLEENYESMIRKLLYTAVFLGAMQGSAQISAGQIDDFNDGTQQDWKHQIANPFDTQNVTNFLRNQNSGTGGPGSRHIMQTTAARWTGDYVTEGIVTLKFEVRNSGTEDLHLRLAMRGGSSFSWIASTNATVVPVGSGWVTVFLSTNPVDFTTSTR